MVRIFLEKNRVGIHKRLTILIFFCILCRQLNHLSVFMRYRYHRRLPTMRWRLSVRGAFLRRCAILQRRFRKSDHKGV